MGITVTKKYSATFSQRSYQARLTNVIIDTNVSGNPIPVIIPSTIP